MSVRALVSSLVTLIVFSTWMPLLSGCRGPASPGNADLQGAAGLDPNSLSDGLGEAGGESTSGIEISAELPHRGYLDLYHSLSARSGAASQDSVANSLYAIRTLVIQDLLKSRAALKSMLGGTARARRLGSADLSFAVPSEVKQLYLLGPSVNSEGQPLSHTRRGSDGQARPSAVGATGPSVQQTAGSTQPVSGSGAIHGFESEILFPEIANTIQWIENTEELEDAAFTSRQAQLSRGLIILAASLARLDQHLKYIETDYWQDSRIREQFERSEARCLREEAANATSYSTGEGPGSQEADAEMRAQAAFSACREQWMQRHGMDRVRQQIAGFKQILAQRYNILNLDMNGVLLYQQIYDKMVALGGFPTQRAVQRPATATLPTGTSPIPFESTFDAAVLSRLDALSDAANRNQLNRIIEGGTVSSGNRITGTAAVIDSALLRMVEQNTIQLRELCGTDSLHYRADSRSALTALARYPELWSEAKTRYQYLGSLIDFDSAQRRFEEYFQADRDEARVRTYAVFAGVIGLTVAAFFTLGSSLIAGGAAAATAEGSAAVAGTSGGFLGLSSGTWVTGTALATAGLAGYNWRQSARSAALSSSLFYGSARSGSVGVAHSDVSIAESDYQLFLSSMLNLGMSLPRILDVTYYARLVAEGTLSRVIAFSNNERAIAFFAVARQAASRARGWASTFPGIGAIARALTAAAENPTGMVGFTETMVQAIDTAVITTRMSRQAIIARLSEIPLFSAIFRAAEQGEGGLNVLSRIKMRPGLIPAIINENIMGVTVSGATQLLTAQHPINYSSWRDFYESAQRNHLFRNLAIGSIEGTVLMVMLFGRGSGLPRTMYDAGISPVERVRRFATMAGRFGAVGFSSAFLTTLATNRTDDNGIELTMEERVRSAAGRGLYEFGFFALSSSVRMQLTNYINSRIFAHVRGQNERIEAIRAMAPRGADGSPQIGRLSAALQQEFRNLEGSSLVLHAVPPAVTGGNDFFAWYHYLRLLQLTGVETADRRVHLVGADGQLPASFDGNAEITGLRAETIGRAYVRINRSCSSSERDGYLFDFMQ